MVNVAHISSMLSAVNVRMLQLFNGLRFKLLHVVPISSKLHLLLLYL